MRSKQQPRPSYHRWLKPEENEEGDDALESPEQKDVLTSGSASPSSTQSLEGAPATTSSTMLRDPESHHSTPTSPQPPPHLIDSHDDVEHNIPATLIQDPSVERELSSPRCLSRDSSVGGRCPSDDSIYSGRGMTGSNATSPVAITLPATLPPAAAAALLPPQSAAMAAYLGVAAAAAQQNRLLFNSSLTAGLTRGGSPPLLSLGSPLDHDSSVLDFSTKRSAAKGSTDSRESDSDAVNLSNKADNGPLDLSVNRKRNAEGHSPQMPSRKQARAIDYKPVVSPWTSPVTPYFAAAVAAASISPKNHNAAVEWASAKGKMGSAPNDATKALEKMSELSRLGGEDIYKQHGGSLGRESNTVSSGSSSGGRHSAWQSHWLNKGADSAKDVLKCVWCKQSFPSLAAMTTHMKETKHCGVNVPPAGGMSQPQPHPPIPTSSSSSGSSTSTSKPSSSDLNLLIKETMPLPRKLVRGQDVWLGKGAEQTRQILKCMWCGQSFRSLAEMTSHMQQTQHYTNIISQEQIISWKSSEDGKGPSGPGNPNSSSANQNAGPNSTVSAVLTCKVCDQAFSSLKDLSNHMVKNAHYKEHIMRSITESGGRRRQTREKRKKSLPVRKLLELERAQHDFKNGESNIMSKTMREAASGRITCEKCGDKIDTVLFVEHIRQCVGGASINSHRVKPPSHSGANSILPPSESVSPLTPSSRDGRKSIGDEIPSPASRHISPNAADLSSPKEGSHEKTSSSPSVLNAIEQLIEKSFDTRSRHSSTGIQGPNQNSAPLGSSILKRLGIDESVDYTKPLIDHQTMNLLRSYQQQQVYGRRERSGSESSSFSDRGSSRVDSLTPERKVEPPLQSSTPRHTPEKQEAEDLSESAMKIKREPDEEEKRDRETPTVSVAIKKEADEEDGRPKSRIGESEADNEGVKLRSSSISSPAPSPRHTPVTPAASPGSDRSTPRSQVNASDSKKPSTGGSLGALSSMFDNLTGGGSGNPQTGEGGPSSGKKGSSHPLAALQKLCDKTETNQNSRTNSASSNSSLASNNPSNVSTSATAPGAILAFSWACNDAVMTSDSIMKCAFCDTPFISKGAYRHHLSKMHFVKDDVIPDPIAVKSQKQIPPPPSSPKNSPAVSSGNGVAPSGSRDGASSSTSTSAPNSASVPTKSPPPGSGVTFEESPHSKFLKYTELAKQLSSKYV